MSDDGLRAAASVGLIEQVHMLLAVEQRERALGLVQQHLAAAPDSPVAHFLLALCRSDAPAAALAHVEDALGLAPDFPAALKLRAELLFHAGRFAEAERSVLRAIAIEPADPGAHSLYASMLFFCDEDEPALRRCAHALSLDPDASELHAQRAQLLLSVHPSRWQVSEDAIRAALRLEPDSADHHALMGFVESRKLDFAAAERSFRAALQLAPGHPLALRGLSMMVQGQSWFYRPMLAFHELLSRLGRDGALGFLFGLWALYNATMAVIPEDWTVTSQAVTGSWLGLCAYTWFSEPITRAVLRRRYPWLE